MRRELPDKGGRGGDKHERFNRFHLDRWNGNIPSNLDLGWKDRSDSRCGDTDRAGVHSQAVACMECVTKKDPQSGNSEGSKK